MRNISFNFITQVVCRLEIQDAKNVCWQIYVPLLLSLNILNVEVLGVIPWLWLQKDAPGGPLFTEFPSEKTFYKHTALFH